MSLVARWADSRIAALFISRLRGGTYTARENSDLMDRIASILDDKQIAAIAEKFSNIYYERNDAEVDNSDLDETDEAAADDEEIVETDASETVTPVSESSDSETTEQKTEKTAEAETKKRPAMTYKQFRDQLIAKFLRRADEVIANPDARNTGKK